jgi:serine/threonine protein kinase/ABC-type branched-subunit amino acid transport system substrate-binding protein
MLKHISSYESCVSECIWVLDSYEIGITGTTMKCPFCGTDNPAGETFCANCGGYLDTSANSQTVIGSVNNQQTVPAQVSNSGSGGIGATTTGGKARGGNSSTLTPNSQLQNGRYVVEKILGQGGMGAAVLARDTRVSNKRVVIKELISDESDPKQRLEDERNFEREVETLASLDHPLIPTVTDSFKEGIHYYMVQEYAPGENLEDYMERTNRPMPEQEALTYISQVLDILVYLSDQKPPIVHRDIKPANIIISSRDKRARLVDFGIARADEVKNAKRKQTTALGTPGYAPPEQYQGNADDRSDVYALAATLHHLVTNRDPRNFPPFSYPPANSLNKQISPELERILERALILDINKRYQSAAAIKHDVDDLLNKRFQTTNHTSSYLLNSSPGITATPPPPPPPPAASSYQGGYGPTIQPNPVTPIPINRGGQRSSYQQSNYQQQQSYAPIPRTITRKKGPNYIVWSFLGLIVVVVIIAIIFFAMAHTGPVGPAYPINSTSTISATSKSIATNTNPISVTMVKGEPIGLSDGNFSFDTSRINKDLKAEAVKAYANNSQAAILWGNAANGNPTTGDSSDAEAHIYQEDARVMTSGSPYITFVVGTILSGANGNVGADDLQGAYVAQSEWNKSHGLGQVQVRLIIANAGSTAANASTVANQIVQAAAKDPTIVGVMGWSFSGHSIDAIGILTKAGIPMVSATASSNDLTGISPDFFRVAPSNKIEADVAATYAQTTLKATKAVVFQDSSDSYSNDLGNDFQTAFKGQVSQVINYKLSDAQSIKDGLAQLKTDPGIIYFAGYASDMNTVLANISSNPVLAKTQILGGDALYELTGYTKAASPNLPRLHFTAFAYPDEWAVLGDSHKTPAFFSDYSAAFTGPHAKTGYGYTRTTGNVMLSYDAMLALLTSSKQALNGGTTMKPTDLQLALTKLKNLQGVSGNITLGPDGDAVNKAVVILYVDTSNRFLMESKLGAGTLLAP